MNQSRAAHAVQGLAVNGLFVKFREGIRCVTPDGIVLSETRGCPEKRFLIGQRQAVVNLFGAPRPDRGRRGVYPKKSVHPGNIGEMSGHVFAPHIIDRVPGDGVRACSGIRKAAARACTDRKAFRQSVNQHISRPRKRRAVIKLAGALRDQGYLLVPGPAAVCRIISGRISALILPGLHPFFDPVRQHLVLLKLTGHEFRKFLCAHFGDLQTFAFCYNRLLS